jgi:hypothetical protein
MAITAPSTGRPDTTRPPSTTMAGSEVAPPTRLRRHPAWVWGGIALITVGGTVSAAMYSSSSDDNEVLAVREAVVRGEVIGQDDLVVVRVGVDPAVATIPASELSAIVGQHAATDLPPGGLLAPGQVTAQSIPPKDYSVVGLSLTGAMVPGDQVQPGDKVRVVATTGEGGDVSTAAPESIEAVVVGVSPDDVTGNVLVSVQVPRENGPRLTLLATAGKASIVLDSSEG